MVYSISLKYYTFFIGSRKWFIYIPCFLHSAKWKQKELLRRSKVVCELNLGTTGLFGLHPGKAAGRQLIQTIDFVNLGSGWLPGSSCLGHAFIQTSPTCKEGVTWTRSTAAFLSLSLEMFRLDWRCRH